MAHEERGRSYLVSAALVVVMGVSLTFASMARAEKAVVAVEGVSYNVYASMADNLKSCMGKKVYITLNSGKGVAGTIKAVGEHMVHVEKIEGKEYFDALVRVEDISAIDVRFREMKR